MSETVLVAETGRPTGSSASRRLRAEDRIPAVVYGHGMTPLSISVARRDLRHALSGSAGMNTVLDLTVDGKVYPAIVKEIQRHPVRRNVQHVDFQQISLDEEITVSVPLRLEGEAREVLSNNGLVDPAVDSIELTTTPRNIPDEIVIDITDMQLDSVIRLEDITLPAGVTTSLDPETVLVTVLVMRGGDEESETAEGAEGAEGEESGEAAEGAEAAEAEAASGDES